MQQKRPRRQSQIEPTNKWIGQDKVNYQQFRPNDQAELDAQKKADDANMWGNIANAGISGLGTVAGGVIGAGLGGMAGGVGAIPGMTAGGALGGAAGQAFGGMAKEAIQGGSEDELNAIRQKKMKEEALMQALMSMRF